MILKTIIGLVVSAFFWWIAWQSTVYNYEVKRMRKGKNDNA